MTRHNSPLATLLFIGVVVLPLLGLLIMDYQLKVANDITGAYLVSPDSAYASESIVGAAIVIGVVMFLLVTFVVGRIRKAKMVHTMPLSKINNEIKAIEEHLKQHKKE